MEVQNKNIHQGSAAERKRQSILSKMLAPSSNGFFQKLRIKEGMHGLDLGCGTGQITALLKTLVGESGKITAIDSDETNINLANEAIIGKPDNNRSIFRFENIEEWTENEVYDFIYYPLLLQQSRRPLSIFQQMFQGLKVGGFAMLEELNPLEFYCFPNCYAFDRFLELYAKVKEQKSKEPKMITELTDGFHEAGFRNVQAQLVQPSLFKDENKHIASLTMESIAIHLLDKKLTTPTELQALLFELKEFENNQIP